MKPIVRYRSQLLFRRSYKPRRALRIGTMSRARKCYGIWRAGLK